MVFGLDETSRFTSDPSSIVEASDPFTPVPKTKYKCQPRPIPECLDFLRRAASRKLPLVQSTTSVWSVIMPQVRTPSASIATTRGFWGRVQLLRSVTMMLGLAINKGRVRARSSHYSSQALVCHGSAALRPDQIMPCALPFRFGKLYVDTLPSNLEQAAILHLPTSFAFIVPSSSGK